MSIFNHYNHASLNLLAHIHTLVHLSNYFIQINSQSGGGRSKCIIHIDILTNFPAERLYQFILYHQCL